MILEQIDGKYFLVQGFRRVRPADPAKVLETLRNSFPTVQIQLIRGDRVAGPRHLYFSARHTLRAWTRNHARSKTVAMEFLLYTSCQHQISRAITILGLNAGTHEVALVAFSGSKHGFGGLVKTYTKLSFGIPDDNVLLIRTRRKLEKLKRVFGLTNTELDAARAGSEAPEETVVRLIIERSALLALEA